MVAQVRKKISNHRSMVLPALAAISLLSGLFYSMASTPSALADYYTGCGYGYNASGTGFGYGTGIAFGYGYNLSHQFGYGYGNEVCPPTTTTTMGGGGGGGGGTTTTSTTSTTTVTTTTTAPVTTTTTVVVHGRPNVFCKKVHGYVIPGRTTKDAITGGGFYGKPSIGSNEFGTKAGAIHDYGNLLIVKVTARHGSKLGWHTFKITVANGHFCKVNYLVK